MKNGSLHINWTRWIFLFVFASLLFSTVFAVVHIVTAPASPAPAGGHGKIKSEYVLTAVQCLLGIAVLLLPSFLRRRLHLAIPSPMYIFYVGFLYAAIYLGEIRSFYERIPHWDMVLHGFSGLMLGALSFSLIDLLNSAERTRFSLSPVFVALFAFCFALSMGVLWEFYEFSMDTLFGLNMQRYATESGQPLVGRAALFDTMHDLALDALGALVTSVVGFISLHYRKGWLAGIVIKRTDKAPNDTPDRPQPSARRRNT